MRSRTCLVAAAWLVLAASASAQRRWIAYPSSFQDDNNAPFITVPGGDYGGVSYKYSSGGATNIERAFWDLTAQNVVPVAPNTDLFPVKPGMYAVEQWAPSVKPSGVTYWDWLPVETTFDGPGAGEEATKNLFIPWNGAYGTNHQWIGVDLQATSGSWVAAGPGPQSPNGTTCAAGPTGTVMWMKRNTTLYTKWDFGFCLPCTHPVTALRLTEVYYDSATCGTATLGGPVDLRCVANADPIYFIHEPFANNPNNSQQTVSIDSERALAVNNYSVWVCLDPGYPYNVPLTPGLPSDGSYTARLADGNIFFKLRYDGFNSIKWKSNDTGEWSTSRVFTLNGTSGREFTPGTYSEVYLLTACSGGRGNRLSVQAVYADNSTETRTVNLYDWFNQDGDANAVPVGVDGYRKAAGALGLRVLGKQGDSVDHGDGGGTNGAFLFVNRVSVNPCKTLAQLKLTADFPYAPSVITESRSGGQNYAGFSTTGVWTPETVKSTVGEVTQGIGSLSIGAGSSGATATFSFVAPVTTYYNVRATWASGLDAATQAAFVITQDGAPVTVFRDQRNDGNNWRDLGQYPMTAGQVYTVTLDAGLSSGGPRVYADAVRWETNGVNANLLAVTMQTGSCCNQPWADVDGDEDVDSADFAALQRCLTVGGGAVECTCLDVGGSGSIDDSDVAAFAACAQGPGVAYIHNASPPYWPNWPVDCPGQPAQ